MITLISKLGKDNLLLQNWRPISLINTDYKILSKVLSNRLIKVLPNIIGEQQYGFMKGKFISMYSRLIADLMDVTKQKKLESFILAIDLEKAFDSLNWQFLFKTLNWFGFGNSFQKWIKLLYTDAKACIINNGFTTNYFNLYNGVRQGDPLSPYLFIMAIEVLALNIINNKSINGIKVTDVEIKICQYADDMTFFLSNTNSVRSFKFV